MATSEAKAIDLSKHAKTLPGFRWMPGMHSTQRGLLLEIEADGTAKTWFDVLGAVIIDDWDLDERPTPDLEKPGTQGCFLDLIAEHNHRRSKFDALKDVAHAMGRGLSMPEALVHVLEISR